MKILFIFMLICLSGCSTPPVTQIQVENKIEVNNPASLGQDEGPYDWR